MAKVAQRVAKVAPQCLPTLLDGYSCLAEGVVCRGGCWLRLGSWRWLAGCWLRVRMPMRRRWIGLSRALALIVWLLAILLPRRCQVAGGAT